MLDDLRDGYLQALRRQGRAETTLRTYRLVLDQFIQMADGRPLDRQLIADWQDRFALHHKMATHASYASSIRGMLKWAAATEYPNIPSSLWLAVEQVRTPRLVPKPLPRGDLHRILTYLQTPTIDIRQLRTRALFYFLLTTFARISEALRIDRRDLVEDTVLVRQKGGSQKVLVLVTDQARTAVSSYLEARTDHHPALFLSYTHPTMPLRLTRDGANKIWQELAHDAGIGRFTNHRLRHTGITEALEGGAPELIVAEQAGHASLKTMRGYALVRVVTRRQIMEKALGPLLAEMEG